MTNEIDQCIIDTFGKIKLPENAPKTILRISDLPNITNEIRKSKYGPKLKILRERDEVTTEFKAGFYGKEARYVEQLFIYFGHAASHKKISELFDHLDRKKLEGLRVDNTKLREEIIKLVNYLNNEREKIYDNMRKLFLTNKELLKIITEAGAQNYYEKAESMGVLNEDIMNAIDSYHQEEYLSDTITEEIHEGLKQINEVIENDVAHLLKPMELSTENELLLKERIIGVWLIAESFRYPPILFYALIILHLYINEYITPEDIKNGIFPAHHQGSQKVLFACFSKASENKNSEESEKGIESISDKDFQELEERKLYILQKLYEGISNVFEPVIMSEFDLQQCSDLVFKEYVNHYMQLCGVKEVQIRGKNFESLMNKLRNPVSQPVQNQERSLIKKMKQLAVTSR